MRRVHACGGEPGQLDGFHGYGGIADPDLYVSGVCGAGMKLVREVRVPEVPSFTMNEFEASAPNCVPTAVTRIAAWLLGYPADACTDAEKKLYERIRGIACLHGYDPGGKGLWYELVRYPPWCIDNILQQALRSCAGPTVRAKSRYLFLRAQIADRLARCGRPMLLNIAFGDYPGHTVTLVGFREYRDASARRTRLLAEVRDGWRPDALWIDLQRMPPFDAGLTWFDGAERKH